MSHFAKPKVFLIGYTAIDRQGIFDYLRDTGNQAFIDVMDAASADGISDGEILCSFYAKLCYASLSLGHNDNITRIRDIPDNIRGAFDSGHGSVFEHCLINFVATRVSRVYTHELVRHRAGTAFSQTSGRYVRGGDIGLVFDPILDPVKDDVAFALQQIEENYASIVRKSGLDQMKDFDKKKKMTSALRRILPNGQSNEIGFSLNVRALRHIIQTRTSRHAEWEIREVFNQVYALTKNRFPLIYHGAKEEVVEGLIEVSGMKMNPYDK